MQWKLIPAVVCFHLSLIATAQVYSFISYTPHDGLVNSRAKSAFQDSRGRMYFITYGGLSIYDGNRFINYTQNNGLCNNVVNDVFEAGPDSILVATNTQQLNAWVKGRMDTLHTKNGFCPTINKFFKSADGRLYVIADEGLYVFTDGLFTKLPLNAEGSSEIHYLGSIGEVNGYFILGTWAKSEKAKLFLFDKKAGRVTDINLELKVLSIIQNKMTGQTLICTGDGIKTPDSAGLLKGKLILHDFKTGNLPASINLAVFTNENQICYFNNTSLAIPAGQDDYQLILAANGLPVNNILSVFIDRENIKWIITDGSGIFKLADTRIAAISQDEEGKKIASTAMDFDSSGLWLYDKLSRRVLHYHNRRFSGFAIPFDIVDYGILLHGDQVIFIGEQNIMRVNKTGNHLSNTQVLSALENPNLSPGRPVVDEKGWLHLNIWGKESSSILSISPEGKKYVYPLDNYVDEIAVDGQDHLWVISRGSPLQSFGIIRGEDSCIRLVHDYTNDLPHFAARSIALDHLGNVIIGSRDQGIFILAMQGTKFISVKNISVNDGLTDNFIYALACDRYNNIWVGSQNGLDILHREGKEYYVDNITRNNNIYETIISIKTNDAGDGFARCAQGNILEVTRQQAGAPSPQPEIFVSSVLVNDKPVYPDSSELVLRHQQNNISFALAAPSFFDEHSIYYSYRLQGSNNKDWSNPSHQSFFNFLNLPPGHYTLHVKAVFPAHRHPDQEMSFPFIVLPAWWQTWLFRILAALASIAILIVGIRSYYRRRLEKERTRLEKRQAVEKERTRIAMDMHDDLGAGLSRIKFLSETIGIKKQQQLPIEEDIGKIREYAHDMIDKMGEIVWALNEKNDTLSDLLAYARAYATEYMMQNGLMLTVQAPDIYPEKFVPGEFRRNIFLTVKEALHNVVKHAAATHVYMDIVADQQLKITIRDDGTGLDEQKLRPFSSGLFNMRTRMEEIGGQLYIDGNGGTTVLITAPL
jgi:signal transduction histidine kinase/ligand-binding sensor domain-containing protein